MKVAWSNKAKTRLREIHDYIAQDSAIRGKQVVDRLTRRSERLALDPRADDACLSITRRIYAKSWSGRFDSYTS